MASFDKAWSNWASSDGFIKPGEAVFRPPDGF